MIGCLTVQRTQFHEEFEDIRAQRHSGKQRHDEVDTLMLLLIRQNSFIVLFSERRRSPLFFFMMSMLSRQPSESHQLPTRCRIALAIAIVIFNTCMASPDLATSQREKRNKEDEIE